MMCLTAGKIYTLEIKDTFEAGPNSPGKMPAGKK
jgi:hypothetical protein